MITTTAILTALFFGGVFYIIFGFWQVIKSQIKHIQEQRKQQQETECRQKELKEEFEKTWKRLEVQDRWKKKK